MAKSYFTQNQHEAAFVKKFNSLIGKYQPWEIWRDFIQIHALLIPVAVDKSTAKARAEEHDRILSRYDKAEQEIIKKNLLDILVEALEENPEQDFLGRLYMQLGLGDHWKGQFFTPYSLCRMMAILNTSECVDVIKQDGWASMLDPSCGAGATLIAGIHAVREKLEKSGNLNWQNHLLVVGQDIDPVTAQMCYIQLSLQGAAGYIKIGDTLCNPMSSRDNPTAGDYWFTPMYFHPIWQLRKYIHRLDWTFSYRQSTVRLQEAAGEADNLTNKNPTEAEKRSHEPSCGTVGEKMADDLSLPNRETIPVLHETAETAKETPEETIEVTLETSEELQLSLF